MANGQFAQYDVTGDNRWIQAWNDQDFYLIDRQEGTAVAWPVGQETVLAAMADRALFVGQNRYILRPMRPPEDPGTQQAALFSKDGRFLAILTGQTLHVVETGTGEVTFRAEVPPAGSGDAASYVSLGYSTGDDEFVVSVFSQGKGDSGPRDDYRYTWTGGLLGAFHPPVVGVLSPDRSLVAS